MKLEVNIKKKYFFTILASVLILVAIIGTVAYGTNNPSVFGHSAGEVEVTIGGNNYTLQQAITQNLLGGGTTSLIQTTWFSPAAASGYVNGVGANGALFDVKADTKNGGYEVFLKGSSVKPITELKSAVVLFDDLDDSSNDFSIQCGAEKERSTEIRLICICADTSGGSPAWSDWCTGSISNPDNRVKVILEYLN